MGTITFNQHLYLLDKLQKYNERYIDEFNIYGKITYEWEDGKKHCTIGNFEILEGNKTGINLAMREGNRRIGKFEMMVAWSHELGHAIDYVDRVKKNKKVWDNENVLRLEVNAWINAINIFGEAGLKNWERFWKYPYNWLFTYFAHHGYIKEQNGYMNFTQALKKVADEIRKFDPDFDKFVD